MYDFKRHPQVPPSPNGQLWRIYAGAHREQHLAHGPGLISHAPVEGLREARAGSQKGQWAAEPTRRPRAHAHCAIATRAAHAYDSECTCACAWLRGGLHRPRPHGTGWANPGHSRMQITKHSRACSHTCPLGLRFPMHIATPAIPQGGQKPPLVKACVSAPLRKHAGSRQLAFHVCIRRRLDRRLRRFGWGAFWKFAKSLKSGSVRPSTMHSY